MKLRRVLVPTVLSMSLVIVACGSPGDSTSAPPTATVRTTVTATTTVAALPSSATASTDSSNGQTVQAGDPNGSAGGTETFAPEPTDGAPKKIESGETLTLSNFFQPSDEWEENRFNIADKSEIPGISSTVESCYANDAQTLEMRLGGKFKELKFSVGQANLSQSTDQRVVARVTGNNSQLDVYRVPFNKFQTFKVDVSRVNALSIEMFLDDDVEDCGGSVQAVLYDMTLQ